MSAGVCARCADHEAVNPYAAPVSPVAAAPRRAGFRLVDLLAGVMVIGLLLSLVRTSEPAGVLAATVVVPALIRVIVAVRRWHDRGEEVGLIRIAQVAVFSIGISTLTVLAITAAFVGACFPVGLAASATGAPYFIFLALIAGLAAAVYVVRWLRPTLWAIDPPLPPEVEIRPGGGIRFLDSSPAAPGEIHYREFDPLFDAESPHAQQPTPSPRRPVDERVKPRSDDPGPRPEPPRRPDSGSGPGV